MIKNCQEFVSSLEKEGLTFRHFSMVQQGEFHPDDADWNYKDVPHLHFIHHLVEAVPARIDEDIIVSINLQKIFGITMPLTVVNIESGPNSQMYFTTMGMFTLVIESTWTAVDEYNTKVTTTYNVGMKWYLLFMFPLIAWSLKRNYKDLMSGDIPMRLRRGQLRSWGYQFVKRGKRYGFAETMAIGKQNVVNSNPNSALPAAVDIDIKSVFSKDGSEYFWGRSDHQGLRIRRHKDTLLFFPRMCPHEGAELDKSQCFKEMITCPWHGRPFKPLTVISLQHNQKVAIDNQLVIEVIDDKLRIGIDLK